MKPWKRILLLLIVTITILSLLLSACGLIERSHGNGNPGKDKDKDEDKDKGKDKEKSKDQDKAGQTDKILICHKTGSSKKPYVQISVSNNAARDGHASHKGDLIPAPEDGCPTK
jgi:hypothetical protein